MRKLATWLLVTLGVAALVRRLRRRRAVPAPAPAPLTTGQDPADELRRKLAETRSESTVSEPPPDATVAERRAEVHDEGRAAIDEMRSGAAEE